MSSIEIGGQKAFNLIHAPSIHLIQLVEMMHFDTIYNNMQIRTDIKNG